MKCGENMHVHLMWEPALNSERSHAVLLISAINIFRLMGSYSTNCHIFFFFSPTSGPMIDFCQTGTTRHGLQYVRSLLNQLNFDVSMASFAACPNKFSSGKFHPQRVSCICYEDTTFYFILFYFSYKVSVVTFSHLVTKYPM